MQSLLILEDLLSNGNRGINYILLFRNELEECYTQQQRKRYQQTLPEKNQSQGVGSLSRVMELLIEKYQLDKKDALDVIQTCFNMEIILLENRQKQSRTLCEFFRDLWLT